MSDLKKMAEFVESIDPLSGPNVMRYAASIFTDNGDGTMTLRRAPLPWGDGITAQPEAQARRTSENRARLDAIDPIGKKFRRFVPYADVCKSDAKTLLPPTLPENKWIFWEIPNWPVSQITVRENLRKEFEGKEEEKPVDIMAVTRGMLG